MIPVISPIYGLKLERIISDKILYEVDSTTKQQFGEVPPSFAAM
jgi:hypothetical protein